MVNYCILCKVCATTISTSSFHRFPKNKDRRSKWLRAINMNEVPQCARLCSNHFKSSDYQETIYGLKASLKKTAIPKIISQEINSDANNNTAAFSEKEFHTEIQQNICKEQSEIKIEECSMEFNNAAKYNPNSLKRKLMENEEIDFPLKHIRHMKDINVYEVSKNQDEAKMISNMRLPKDANKIKGYGYVEFEDRQSLIDALSMTNTTIKTRRVRIEVSNSSNDDRRSGRMGRDSRRDNYDDPERTSGDWRSGPREDLLDGDSYRSRYDRDRYDNRDRRDDRERHDYDNKPGAWRERDSNDKGSSFKDRGGFRDDSKDRDRDRDWNRYGDRGRSKDRDGDRSSSFGPRRNYGDSDWDRDRRQDRDAKPEPRQRPKLNLQPRTKPVEPLVVAEDSAAKDSTTESKSTANTESTQRASAATAVPAANIFGAAKPVDTTAREREIEERLAKSYAESRSREETDIKERKDGTWGRRNGEGRDDKEKERGRPAWRSEEDRGARLERSTPRSQPTPTRAEEQSGSKTSPATSRSGLSTSKGSQKSVEKDTRAAERDRKDKEKDEISRMPKAKDEQAPNFVASNKYSMLPDDVDPDNIDE
ncbi:Eukaryotic translation initiation factor 4B [Acromyrmex echinatior]|uniref:Eukaryotic translation initiation factor 4B n=1 Tax=Acromyrmex echinatior TaxID=103372 RepID=F4WMY8_ACREC|nr:Eukaryotic translation initiation factor 4B [Acromyrmex echinatior]